MGFSASVFLSDPDSTDRFGRDLSTALRPGDTLLFEGQIGAGKTHLARAIIRNLLDDPDAIVPSPTFTLVQTYEVPGSLLWHVDLYRLGDPSEGLELGLDEALGRDIVLVEWPERLDHRPADGLTIALKVEGAGRVAHLTAENARWGALCVFKGNQDA